MSFSINSSTVKRYALIEGGTVTNIVSAEPGWDPGTGKTLVELADTDQVIIGDEHNGTNFTTEKMAVALTTDQKMADLRAGRNALLAQTDWTQQGDVPSATKTKWQTYRQELRDLPANTADPTWLNITWPTEPSQN